MKITLLEQNHSSFFVFSVSFGSAEAPFVLSKPRFLQSPFFLSKPRFRRSLFVCFSVSFGSAEAPLRLSNPAFRIQPLRILAELEVQNIIPILVRAHITKSLASRNPRTLADRH